MFEKKNNPIVYNESWENIQVGDEVEIGFYNKRMRGKVRRIEFNVPICTGWHTEHLDVCEIVFDGGGFWLGALDVVHSFRVLKKEK